MTGTDLSKLKGGKGQPPPADAVPDITSGHGRGDAPLRPLQVRIPADVFEEFGERAGREFGFSRGAKKRLFLKMWETYKAR